jgi:hypothetical protein
VAQLLQRAGDADPAGLSAVAVGHRVGVPGLAACRVGRERERVFWDLDAEGTRLGAAAPEVLLEQLAGQQVQGQDAATDIRSTTPSTLSNDSVRFTASTWEPPIGIEPMTYALRVRRSNRLS